MKTEMNYCAKLRRYTVQILSNYDAFRNQLLGHWFTVEWRTCLASNANQAIRNVGTVGPFGSIGKVFSRGKEQP